MTLDLMLVSLDTWPIDNAPDTWPIANVSQQLVLSQYYWSGLLASPEVSNQLVRPARSDNGVQAYSAFIANVRAMMANQQVQPYTQDLFSPE
jgi:hypothetical protein